MGGWEGRIDGKLIHPNYPAYEPLFVLRNHSPLDRLAVSDFPVPKDHHLQFYAARAARQTAKIRSGSPGGPAAVDEEARPGHERRRRRGQKHDRRSHLVDRADAAQRDAVVDPFAEYGVAKERLG